MKLALWVALLVGAASVFCPARADACAGCSNPNLPGARGGANRLRPGEIQIALNLTATTMRVVHPASCPDIGPICAERPEPPQQHDQRFYVVELRPIIAVGITPWLGAELQAPLRLIRTIVSFRRADGALFEPDYPNIHHRDETLVGIADPWLLGRTTWTRGTFALTGRLGTGVPLGSTEPDPFAAGRAGRSHQHIQLGTGTFYPVAAVDATVGIDRSRVTAYMQTLLFLYENSQGYRAGNRYSVGGAVDTEVLRGLRLGIGVDLLNEQPERWGGVIQQDGNVGRTDLLAGGSVAYAAGSWLASLSVRVPIWQHFIEAEHTHGNDPGQLTYPAIINLAVQTSFGGERSSAVLTKSPNPG